jgi:hypothetical protein
VETTHLEDLFRGCGKNHRQHMKLVTEGDYGAPKLLIVHFPYTLFHNPSALSSDSSSLRQQMTDYIERNEQSVVGEVAEETA